jgi:hypothetical protein
MLHCGYPIKILKSRAEDRHVRGYAPRDNYKKINERIKTNKKLNRKNKKKKYYVNASLTRQWPHSRTEWLPQELNTDKSSLADLCF